jgi:hypothetical protein
MHRSNLFARAAAACAAAALLFALPALASDRDHDRGHGGHHHDRDDFAEELRELKARVRRLEGHLKRDELVGAYTLNHIQVALLSSAPPLVGRLEHLNSTGLLQLNANGSFSYAGRETGWNAIWQFPTTRNRVDRADSFSGTWAYSGGNLVLTVDGGEVLTWTGGVGGRLWVHGGSNPADGTNTLLLLVKNN